MRNILVPALLMLGGFLLLVPAYSAHADDRSNDRIVHALERIADALEHPKCR